MYNNDEIKKNEENEQKDIPVPETETESTTESSDEEITDEVHEEDSAEESVPEVPEKEIPEMPKKEKGESAFAYVARIAGILAAICIVIAVLLACVNKLTYERIQDNITREKQAAVAEIFTDSDSAEEYAPGTVFEDLVVAVYLAKSGDAVIGYCVNVQPAGFGGAIDMMVGINADGSVCGVKIISMSETPGLGSRVKEESFLAQFVEKSGFLTVGDNVDAVSGATISSKAVTAGINAALSVKVNANLNEIPEKIEIDSEAEEPVIDNIPEEPVIETDSSETEPEVSDEDGDASAENSPEEELPEASDKETEAADGDEKKDTPSGQNKTTSSAPVFAAANANSAPAIVIETNVVFTEETEPPETDEEGNIITESMPVETETVETEPAVIEPAETEPPVETEPVETDPPVTEPVDIDWTDLPFNEPPVETEPVETEPVETEKKNQIAVGMGRKDKETEQETEEETETEPVETEPAETEEKKSGLVAGQKKNKTNDVIGSMQGGEIQ